MPACAFFFCLLESHPRRGNPHLQRDDYNFCTKLLTNQAKSKPLHQFGRNSRSSGPWSHVLVQITIFAPSFSSFSHSLFPGRLANHKPYRRFSLRILSACLLNSLRGVHSRLVLFVVKTQVHSCLGLSVVETASSLFFVAVWKCGSGAKSLVSLLPSPTSCSFRPSFCEGRRMIASV